jgi:hypothetical protein
VITHPYVDNVTGHEAARQKSTNGVLVIAGLLDRLQYREDLEGFEVSLARSLLLSW